MEKNRKARISEDSANQVHAHIFFGQGLIGDPGLQLLPLFLLEEVQKRSDRYFDVVVVTLHTTKENKKIDCLKNITDVQNKLALL